MNQISNTNPWKYAAELIASFDVDGLFTEGIIDRHILYNKIAHQAQINYKVYSECDLDPEQLDRILTVSAHDTLQMTLNSLVQRDLFQVKLNSDGKFVYGLQPEVKDVLTQDRLASDNLPSKVAA